MGKRIVWIDIAKGLGIILVIAGHLFRYDSYISTVIFSFHMPLFFFFAGLVEHDGDLGFSKYFKKALKKLILPWGMFFAIGLIVTLSIPAWRASFDASLTPVAFYTLTADYVHVGQIWFLSCLFDVKIMFYFFNKFMIKSKNLPFIFFTLAGITIIQLPLRIFAFKHFPYGQLPFELGVAFIGLVFYTVGYFYKNYKDEPSKRVGFLTFIICAMLVLYSPKNGHVNMAAMDYEQDYLFYIFAFAGIFFIIFVSKFITELSWKWAEKGKSLLQYIGRNSLYMFVFHSFGLYMWQYIVSVYRHDTIVIMENMRHRDCLMGTFFVLAFTLIITLFLKYIYKIVCRWAAFLGDDR